LAEQQDQLAAAHARIEELTQSLSDTNAHFASEVSSMRKENAQNYAELVKVFEEANNVFEGDDEDSESMVIEASFAS
jgi:hypothetical protein